MLAPICLFTYNRLLETQKTINSLRLNHLASESDLFIFSDGAKNEKAKINVEKVRDFLKTIKGFKSIRIFESDENKGLAKSIISGVSQIIEKYGRVIVLEDDLITSVNFLKFMNQSLDYYENEKMIQTINGFSLNLNLKDYNESSAYFQIRPFPWGWATWSNRWNRLIFDKSLLKVEVNKGNIKLNLFKKACGNDIVKMFLESIENKNNSWYVLWTYNHFISGTYSVYPTMSLIENIGFGDDGTHCKTINAYSYLLDTNNDIEYKLPKFKYPNEKEVKAFLYYFSQRNKLLVRMKLLKSSNGRKLLFNEVVTRILKK